MFEIFTPILFKTAGAYILNYAACYATSYATEYMYDLLTKQVSKKITSLVLLVKPPYKLFFIADRWLH